MVRERNCDERELYDGRKIDRHEFETGFCISRHVIGTLFVFEPVNEISVKLRLNLNITNLDFISTQTPTEGKCEVDKKSFIVLW
jgi:hypothetical protein